MISNIFKAPILTLTSCFKMDLLMTSQVDCTNWQALRGGVYGCLPSKGVLPESWVQVHGRERTNTTPQPLVSAYFPSDKQRAATEEYMFYPAHPGTVKVNVHGHIMNIPTLTENDWIAFCWSRYHTHDKRCPSCWHCQTMTVNALI